MAKNTHMTHLEDAVFLLGIEGTRQSVNFLIGMRETLNGTTNRPTTTSVKWDGAPAIFIGQHPETKEFIVAKKSLFNKEPLFYKSIAEINATKDLNPELKSKFKAAFEGYKNANIRGIIQGDFLWENKDLKTEIIDGEEVVTFHPNTIVYSVPKDSDLGKKIAASKFGIVWHTTYTGRTLQTMNASFGVRMPAQPRQGVQFDAMYKDVAGSASLTKSESRTLARHLTLAGRHFKKIQRSSFAVFDNEALAILATSYTNSYIRANRVPSERELATGFLPYLDAYSAKQINALKSDAGKKRKRMAMSQLISPVRRMGSEQIGHMFSLYHHLQISKNMLVKKLNSSGFIKTFLKTQDGWKVTGQEGFVAIDKSGANAVKLVDRLDFSYANFSPDVIKGWQTDLRR